MDENTIGVMPTFGVTFTCQYEPVAEVAKALDRLAHDKGLDIPMHVDAASGGFVAPFVEPDLSGIFVSHGCAPSMRLGTNMVWPRLA